MDRMYVESKIGDLDDGSKWYTRIWQSARSMARRRRPIQTIHLKRMVILLVVFLITWQTLYHVTPNANRPPTSPHDFLHPSYYHDLNTTCSTPTEPHNLWRPSAELDEFTSHDRRRTEVDSLSWFWRVLTDLFHANPPHPRYIIRPILSRPSSQKIQQFTKEMADSQIPLDDKQAKATRDAHNIVVDYLPPYSSVQGTFRGRGIVIVAGGDYLAYAATCLNALRQLGSDLPVEIWAKDEAEEDQAWSAELKSRGAVMRRISDYAPVGSNWDWINPLSWLGKPRPWSPYQIKVMALLFSSFEEVLFLDADCMPARDPVEVFESQVYKEYGALIWPDLWPSIASEWLPYITNMTETRSDILWHEQAAESGQMVWDKRRHWKSLLLACYYNFYGQAFWYTATIGSGQGWGDKDTYITSLQALGEPYHMIPHLPERVNAAKSQMPVINLQFAPAQTPIGPSNPTLRPGQLKAAVSATSESGKDSSWTEEEVEEHITYWNNTKSHFETDPTLIPLFLHTSGGIKWSLIDFQNAYKPHSIFNFFRIIFHRRSSHLHKLLEDGSRLLSIPPQLLRTEQDVSIGDEEGVKKNGQFDPEPKLWQAMEYTACWSKARGSAESCRWVRDRIAIALGQEYLGTGSIHCNEE